MYKDYFLLDNKNITYGKNNSDYNISNIATSLYATKFKLNDEIAMKYTSKLERVVKDLKNCEKCKNLNII